ncbi:male-enhanced antigen 1 [Ceratina calcarata]|uniref:Male-enhanced antigen 1 n=1 Tax=Ceratina calcarata TaxID=156304 RepID=A0AAJ7IR58_9HYME|nr:male-enhanced antigen 1 [Ceratina calcarata]XP_017875166.1 male-enhanced antigen 1 [Ceratina calcarata]XP_017875167.1 male-enhanced antigen 1 [Ceratina calcarata]XP_026666983.1 male-enhanced antigen 1 [Ceratina calcarata]
MSPDPTQEPVEETLSVPNLPFDARGTNESDSEDDDIGIAGYLPLSQVPADSDPILYEDEDVEWAWSNTGEPSQVLRASSLESQQNSLSETIEVWSSSHNRSNIDMDADKIDQVKSMMATFTLPVTAIPEWANTISEEQWKEQLIGRIKEIQNREK